MTHASPLHWPDGWPRTPREKLADSKYRFARNHNGRRSFWTLADARDSLLDELRQLGGKNAVLSTNFELRNDGLPRSGQRAPDDPGVALYFMLDGRPMVMAQDAHARAEENMRSLALAIAAMRALERHGGGVMVSRAFDGFAALPPPGGGTAPAQRHWSVVLEFKSGQAVTYSDAQSAFRRLVKKYHQDGSQPDPIEYEAVQTAWQQAREELTR